MIFLGDIACPHQKTDMFIGCVNEETIFNGNIVVANLEGNILEETDDVKTMSLFNSPKIAEAFSQAEKVIYSLANNHMYDYPDRILQTKKYLESKGIGCFGLYEKDGSIKPYEYFSKEGVKYAFFGHCWRLYTQTNRNKRNDVRVVDCGYDKFIKVIREYIESHTDTKVFCFMHWNFDMEELPFPMHRVFSRELIDIGVEGVIGSHTHVPQGVEIYKNKVIAYCLGNFYIPSGHFFGGKLIYPQKSRKTIGISLLDRKAIFFKTDQEKEVSIELVETLTEGTVIDQMTEFRILGEKAYIKFFKKNRTKKAGVPIYRSYAGVKYTLQENYNICRVNLIREMKHMNR